MRIHSLRNTLLGSALSIAAFAIGVPTPALAGVLLEDTGWQYDQVDVVGLPSESSPVTFNVSVEDAPGIFSLSDGFIAGDVYTISVNGGPNILSTFTVPTHGFDVAANNFGPAAVYFAADFLDPTWSHLQVLLAPGDYSITITGDGAGGIPAGFGVRLDSVGVPEPLSLSLFGAGLAGVAAMRRRKKKQA